MGISTIPTVAVVPPGLQTDINEIDAYAADGPRRDYIAAAKATITGGGILSVDTSFNVKWTQRFILIGAGRATAFNPGGFFQIDVPAAGTVITGVGGATNKTVVAAGIPLAAWDALYYILPLGSALAASVPANFRVVNYIADFVVPPEWVLVAVRNDDGSGAVNAAYDEVYFCTGDHMTPWIQPSLLNGWVHYSAPYGPGRYRKYNGCVMGSGILSSGTVGPNIVGFTLPVGFRPAVNEVLTASTSPIAGAPYYSEIRVRIDGSVAMQTGTTGYLSLANINFQAEA